MVSDLDCCKHFLVTLLRTLAAAYGCREEVTRDSSDADAARVWRVAS